ncbi:hypothetical protein [Rhodoferax sp.]|uniref:hypothetical protein n=1 Tax=Rhodoferax sp. TaxID=50421 RepID=UPI00374C9C1B
MLPDIVTLVRQQKALARRNQTVRNVILLVTVALCVGLSLAWMALAPTDGITPSIKILIGIVAGCMLAELVRNTHASTLFPKDAACPACGHNWEIKEGRTVPQKERMPTWDRCPGCGILMNEAVLALHLRAPQPKNQEPSHPDNNSIYR